MFNIKKRVSCKVNLPVAMLSQIEDLFSAIDRLPQDIRDVTLQRIRMKLSDDAVNTAGAVSRSKSGVAPQPKVSKNQIVEMGLDLQHEKPSIVSMSLKTTTEDINKESPETSDKVHAMDLVSVGKVDKTENKVVLRKRNRKPVKWFTDGKSIPDNAPELDADSIGIITRAISNDSNLTSNTSSDIGSGIKAMKIMKLSEKSKRFPKNFHNNKRIPEASSGSKRKIARTVKKVTALKENYKDDENENEDSSNDDDDIDNSTKTRMRIFRVPRDYKQKDINKPNAIADIKIIADAEDKQNDPNAHLLTKICYGCTVCPRNFLARKNLFIHMRTHTGEKPFTCSKCDKKFVQQCGLYMHMKQHDGVLDHKCPHCDYRSLRKIDMTRHISRRHCNARNFVCHICAKGFAIDVALKEHLHNVHERTSRHMCHLCGHVTHNARSLYVHVRNLHDKINHHQCPVCGQILKRRATFVAHLRTHTGEKPFPCSTCNRLFTTKTQMKKHMLTHRIGTVQCEICERAFKTRGNMLRHKLVHTGEKPFKCPHCNYNCNVAHNIDKHVRAVHRVVDFTWGKHLAEVGNDKQHDGVNENESYLSNDGEKDRKVGIEAKEKGEMAADEFLSNMSLRKEEGLSVSDLKQKLLRDQEKKMSAAKVILDALSKKTKRKIRNKIQTSDNAYHNADSVNHYSNNYDRDLLEECQPTDIGDQPSEMQELEYEKDPNEYLVEMATKMVDDRETEQHVICLIDCSESVL